MARSHFFTDRALIIRQEVGETLGMKFKEQDVELGDWIPCRLREPSGDVDNEQGKYAIAPSHELHLNPYDLSGVRIKVRQSDTLRVYQRINDYWVEFETVFRIVGPIIPKRRRTRLVSYIIPLLAPEAEY